MNDCKHYFFLNDFNIANISKSRCKYSEWIATIAAAASFTGDRYLVTDFKCRYLSEINS